jgi:2,4-dienoyl-CoA reductase-like NADH-dependent reductase (Old Yellow Enzyme family)
MNPLFQPVNCRGKIIPTRVLLAPINTGFAQDGRPTIRLLRFHAERSGPALGISMLGNVAVNFEGRTNLSTAVLSSQAQSARYAVIARAIRARGSLPGIQLACSLPELEPPRIWRAKNKAAETMRLSKLVTTLPEARLQQHLDEFVNSASVAAAAGFEVIQIHAAHGYLLSLLLNEQVNLRKGRFSYMGQWVRDLFERILQVIGSSLLSVRLSFIAGVTEFDKEARQTIEVCEDLLRSGVDMFDFSAGIYTLDRQMIYPGRARTTPVYWDYIPEIAARIDAPLVVAGRITNLNTMAQLPGNVFVSLGRAMIADPGFAEKSAHGRDHQINPCTLVNQCHYFSRGRPSIECGVNPNL